jgi:carboxyl-terminal processing protease
LLDPYSSFLSSGELSEVESQIEGNFVGLGIALQPHEVPLRILNVIPGGPALESGLQAGDRIVEVGSVRCSDVGAERAADLLRGPEQSKVRLLVDRDQRGTFEVYVDRRRVEVASVENAHIIDQETGAAYLKINSFQKTTVNELDAALFSLERQQMRSLIIDLRGNPGGWLDAAVAVADRFIGDGVIVSTRGKNGIENQNYTAVRGGTWQMPLVVLIDGDSASASEIFAGAIRDHQRGWLVGKTSYGKGSVQGLFHTKSFPGGVRLTVSKFYSPSGAAISDRGVAPHVPVEAQLVAKPEIERQLPVSERSVLSQAYTAAKPALSDASAPASGGAAKDLALEIAIAQIANPRYSAQMNRN